MKAAGGWVPCDKAGDKGAWWADDRQEELEGAILERNALVSLFVFCCGGGLVQETKEQ